jgi:hypothetical protein
MLCPLIFLLKINNGEIRIANPQLSANAKRFDSHSVHFLDSCRKLRTNGRSAQYGVAYLSAGNMNKLVRVEQKGAFLRFIFNCLSQHCNQAHHQRSNHFIQEQNNDIPENLFTYRIIRHKP